MNTNTTGFRHVPVLWTKVASALEGLILRILSNVLDRQLPLMSSLIFAYVRMLNDKLSCQGAV